MSALGGIVAGVRTFRKPRGSDRVRSYQVRVEVVGDSCLGYPWVVAESDDGECILFITESTPLAEVLAGFDRGKQKAPGG